MSVGYARYGDVDVGSSIFMSGKRQEGGREGDTKPGLIAHNYLLK